MIKNLYVVVCLMLIFSINKAFSQEAEAPKEERTPVEDAFACTMLIENQTISQPRKKAKEFIIHHRIGKIESIRDLFGLYAPANIRLGINYGVTDKLMIGFGTERFNKMQELMWKYSLLQQQENGMPFFLSYFGNIVINAQNEFYFGKDYKFVDRISYFHQLIVARKFSDKFSFQIAPYFLHFNKVDSIYSNQAVGTSIGCRYKIWNEISFMGEFNYVKPFETSDYPGFSFGLEKNTGTHAFQLFATNYNSIIAQKNYLYNRKVIGDSFKTLLIGFNITVRF